MQHSKLIAPVLWEAFDNLTATGAAIDIEAEWPEGLQPFLEAWAAFAELVNEARGFAELGELTVKLGGDVDFDTVLGHLAGWHVTLMQTDGTEVECVLGRFGRDTNGFETIEATLAPDCDGPSCADGLHDAECSMRRDDKIAPSVATIASIEVA